MDPELTVGVIVVVSAMVFSTLVFGTQDSTGNIVWNPTLSEAALIGAYAASYLGVRHVEHVCDRGVERIRRVDVCDRLTCDPGLCRAQVCV